MQTAKPYQRFSASERGKMSKVNARNIYTFIFRFVFGYTIAIGLVFSLRWTYYTYFDSYTVPTVYVPIEILNDDHIIDRGDTIHYIMHYDKPQDMHTNQITRQIICKDGNLVTLSDSSVHLPNTAGWEAFESDSIVLPMKTSTGTECRLEIIPEFQANPVKVEIVELYTDWFRVVR